MSKTKLLSIILLLMMACECMAIPVNPRPCKIQQPDGTFVTLRMHGDEYLSYITTADGFTVVKDERGFWVYASKQANGTLAATSVVAHDEAARTADEKSFLLSTPRQITPAMDSRMAKMRQEDFASRKQVLQKRRTARRTKANERGLIILLEFNDKPFMYGDEMNSIMNDIANKENYKGDSRTNYVDESKGIDARFYGSIRDYFRDNSNGQFVPQFDIVGPIKLNHSQYDPDKLNNVIPLLEEALADVDPQVDFSKYDGDKNGEVDLLFFIFAGMGSHSLVTDQRLIWPHASSINILKDRVNLGRYACSVELEVFDQDPIFAGIGTICHEINHVLGLPDFYDTDYAESGGEAADPGQWSIMSSGSYNNYERVPSSLSLFERHLLGFCDDPPELKKAGTYSMREISTNDGYTLDIPNTEEFIIFENRQQTGWDTFLPGHGMMAYRVDFSDISVWNSKKINVNPSHMYYEPLFAGGNRYGMSAYDPFPGAGDVTMLTNNTSPANLKSWAGVESPLVLAHITEKDGIITFDLVDAKTLREIVLPTQQDMYEGICYHLNPAIYMPDENYQTHWTSDNPSVASVDQDGNVTALAEGTANITLAIDTISATCSVTVKQPQVVPNIGKLPTVASGTEQVLQLNNAQVFFSYFDGNNLRRSFVREGGRSVQFSTIDLDVETGDLLNGRIYAIYQEETDWMWLRPITDINYAGSIQVTHGAPPVPDEVTFDNLYSHYIMDYIKMSGVTLAYRNNSQGKEELCVVDGNRSIIVKNKYLRGVSMPSKAELAENRYDVEGVISYLNTPGDDDTINLTAPITVYNPSGIEDVPYASQHQKGQIYNLQGQRLNSLQKGLNIVDKKKILY